MQSVFSHIVQRRLSRENENVATEALAYILRSDAPRKSLGKLLASLTTIPELRFRTQQSEDGKRPDMWGSDEDGNTRVFIENKFWAGLTDNQPGEYIKALAKRECTTLLLVIAPEARIITLWRELTERLAKDGITITAEDSTGMFRSAQTSAGPKLALTSWGSILGALEPSIADNDAARSDLQQLRALCDEASSDAFKPITPEEVTGQRTPELILQLSDVVQAAVDGAVEQGVLHLGRLKPQANTERIGRYACIGGKDHAGVWLGVHFTLWRQHGVTPLWAVFSGDWGRADEVCGLLEPWAMKHRVFSSREDDAFVVALSVSVREEKDAVVKGLVSRLKAIADVLSDLKPKAQKGTPDE